MVSRLPTPGSDSGQWGQILNDYLSVSHGADGALLSSAVLTAVPAGGIIKSQLSSSVQASLDNADAAVAGTVVDATSSVKGKLKLAGDLVGTADLPTIATGAVSTAKLADGAITDVKIATGAAIAKSKLAALNISDSDVSAISPSKITGTAVVTSQLGVVSGVATLDGTGKVTASQLPSLVSPLIITGSQAGALVATFGQVPYIVTQASTIQSVRCAVGTTPTGQAIIVDINKNGASIFTTQANRPSITAGTILSAAAVPDVTALAVGDLITFDVDQVGSTAAGADLSIAINARVN